MSTLNNSQEDFDLKTLLRKNNLTFKNNTILNNRSFISLVKNDGRYVAVINFAKTATNMKTVAN